MKKLSLLLSLFLLTSGLIAIDPPLVLQSGVPLEEHITLHNHHKNWKCDVRAKIIIAGINARGKTEERAGYAYIRNLKRLNSNLHETNCVHVWIDVHSV